MRDLDIKNLPEEITLDVYLHVHDQWGFSSVTNHADMEGYTCISGPIQVTFKTKSNDEIMNNAIASLREAISKIRAESEAQCAILEDKIQSYLALHCLTWEDRNERR